MPKYNRNHKLFRVLVSQSTGSLREGLSSRSLLHPQSETVCK